MQKKFVFLTVILLMAIRSSVFAYDFSSVAPSGQTLYYNIVDGNAQVTYEVSSYPRYTNLSGNLVIPDTVIYGGNTYAVTSIGDYTFYGCSGLTSVTIGNGVASIGNGAFNNCSGLTSITIPDSVTAIGNSAFYGCGGLTSITIPDAVTSIGEHTFYGCSGLTSVTIPDAVTSIGEYAFYNCSGLTSITIPDGVNTIGNYAFGGCSGLTSVTIPGGVNSIGNHAFGGCSSLISVAIPETVTSIGYGAFSGSSSLASIVVSSSNATYDSRNNCNAIIETATNTLIAGCKNTTIPNSVTAIGLDAFSGCSGLTSVTIPDAVTHIGDFVFSGCSGLISVTIGEGVISIGYDAFSGCSGLTSVTIPDDVTSIGKYAFSGCSGLTSVTIGNGVASIGNGAFNKCSGLTSVAFNADSCTSAGSSNYSAFYNCTNITNFTFGNNAKVIPAYLCYGLSGLTSVTIPDGVTSIGKYAFSGCSGLTSVTIGNGVDSIGYGAFYNCSGLTSVAFNADSCTSTSGSSFYNCTNITNFTFGDSVKVIPGALCFGLSSLTSVTIPDAVTSIGGSAFSDCSGLTSVTIGEGVTSIGAYAFSGCSGLTSITIPDGVTSIGERSFYNCNGLDTVYMKPTAAPSLGIFAFENNAAGRIFILNSCSYNSYYNGYGWTDYRSNLFVPIIDLNVTVSSNAPERGQASIIPLDNNDIRCDSTVVVEATASYGYHFDHWSTGSNANPDTIHLVGDTNVTAFFAPNLYSMTVNADEHGTGGGSGTYSYGDTIMIQAFPEEHYHFIRWDDGNLDNPRQVVVTGDLSFTAFFAIDTHTVHVATNDIARGMVEATGTEFVYGTPCTVTATAYTGYTFAGWSNGVNANPYTFAVLSDVELTALFVAEGEQTYTVTVVSDDPTMGTVSGGGQALDGGTVTIRAVGNPGYHFLRWNDNNTDSVRTVEVHGNVTYTAYFASNSTEAIDDVNGSNIKVYAIDGRIVVEGRENRPVWVFDMYGRVVDNGQLPSGVYLVKVGTLPARKVVVIR